MSEINYTDITKRNNKGVIINENDSSLYDITTNYNRMSLVIGTSKKGVFNQPVICVSPQNFNEIFGDTDYNLERKESYFHRTVKNMLPFSPVICLNLRLTDDDKDKYNWINISTCSDNVNSNTRTNSISDFYNIQDGFWKRSPEQLLDLTNNLASNNPLSFVNMNSKTISILLFKSSKSNFDINVEDYYTDIPDYLNSKDLISDYIIDVVAVYGEWNNYKELCVHPVYSYYFNYDGIKTDKVQEFLNRSEISVVRYWNCSLIPYFRDKNGNDLFIESVINNDINETGIMCSYDIDIQDDMIDLKGSNLISNKKPLFDFLSYKRFISDFKILEEKTLDNVGNSFGYSTFNSNGRMVVYGEGYVHNVTMKPTIMSTTSTVLVKPFNVGSGAYAIINGKYIDINTDISDTIALHEHLINGYHIPYCIVLTSNGVEFRFGKKTLIGHNLYMPYIDAKTEICIAYYEIIQDLLGNNTTTLYPIVLDTDGYIEPYNNIDVVNDTHTQTLIFKNIKSPDIQNFIQLRTYHLWYWLSNSLKEKESVTIDSNNLKQNIKWIEQSIIEDDRIFKIYIDTIVNDNVVYYMNDNEFLTKNDYWKYNKAPLNFGTNGLIGYDAFLVESYLNGEINSGDPFFWGLFDDYNVHFFKENGQNVIYIPNTEHIYNGNIIIENTKYNNGYYTVLNMLNDKIYVKEDVTEEIVDYIRVFDANNPLIINLYQINDETIAYIERWDGNDKELYLKLKEKNKDSIWNKTLEIEKVINSNTIVVDWKRYVNLLDKDYYLLGIDNKMTKIIDIYRLSEHELVVKTNSPIYIKIFENDLQTNIYRPIWKWITSLDFKVLNGFKIRHDVFPDGSDNKLKEILNILNGKMGDSLTSDRMEYRYIVDSFGGGNYQNSKQELIKLSEKKQFALSFINVPSIKQLKKDGTKYTKDFRFDCEMLVTGGNRKYNYGESFSMYESSNGVYLTPYVSIYENNRYYNVPPSSFVASKYMQKFNDTKLKIWDVVAGVNNYFTNINGIEYQFNNDDLKILDNNGITCIAKHNNYYYLYNQLTSISLGLLKNIHNREALIELEMSLYKVMKTIQWDIIDQDDRKLNYLLEFTLSYYKGKKAISNYSYEILYDNEFTKYQIKYIKIGLELIGKMHTIILDVNIFKNNSL